MNDLYLKWKESADPLAREDLISLSKAQLEQSFSNLIKFGDLGVIARIGMGISFMNNYTIAIYAFSFSKYLKKSFPKNKKINIFINHDGKEHSSDFTRTFSEVLSGQGINVYYESLEESSPNTLTSYISSKNDFSGGVSIGASTKDNYYSGIKFYDSDGYIINKKQEEKIYKIALEELNPFNITKTKENLFKIDRLIIDEYVNKVIDVKLLNATELQNNKIVFSPLTGSCTKPISLTAAKLGIDFILTESERRPQGGYVKLDNYDIFSVSNFKQSIKVANKINSNLIILNSIDGERLSSAVKKNGIWNFINGNELSMLQLNYFLTKLKKQNKINPNSFIIKKFTATKAIDKIAKIFDLKVVYYSDENKNIKDIIAKNKNNFLGYFDDEGRSFFGNNIRHYDAIQQFVSLVDMYSYYNKKNKNLFDLIQEIYSKIGYYNNQIIKRNINSAFSLDEVLDDISSQATNSYMGIDFYDIVDYRKKHDNFKCEALEIKYRTGVTLIIKPSKNDLSVTYYISHKSKIEISAMEGVNQVKRNIESFIFNKTKIGKKNSNKSNGREIFRYMLFFAITLGLVLLILLTQFLDQIPIVFNYFNNWESIGFLFASLALTLVPIAIGAFLLYHYGRHWKNKARLGETLITSSLGVFGNLISPMGLFTYPIQIWYLLKKGHSTDEVVSAISIIVVIQSISSFMFILTFSAYGTTIISLYQSDSALIEILWVGTSISFLLQMTYIVFALSNRLTNNMLILLQKTLLIFSSKNFSDVLIRNLQINVRSKKINLRDFFDHKIFGGIMVILCLSIRFSVSSQMYLAASIVGIEDYISYIDWITISSNSIAANTFNPAPGSTGTIEFFQIGLTELYLSNSSISADTISSVSESVTLINRMLTLYLPIILGALFFIIIIFSIKSNKNSVIQIEETVIIDAIQYAS